MLISDWSSDVCSSDLLGRFQLHRTHLEVVVGHAPAVVAEAGPAAAAEAVGLGHVAQGEVEGVAGLEQQRGAAVVLAHGVGVAPVLVFGGGREHAVRRHRSEEHTSELQSLMRISYA